MNAKPIVAGVAAGIVVATGGMVAFDAVSEPADAQGSTEVTQADLRSANQRSIRAIKQGTRAWNLVAKYLAQPGERVAAGSPRVRQEAGVGGGIPGPLIAAETIDESRLSDGVRAKLDGGGQPGPQGPQGPRGPQGPQGPSGSLTGPAGGELAGTVPDP